MKERAYHGTLVQDEEAERIVKESRQWELIYNLKAMQVAEELTRRVREREEEKRERERDALMNTISVTCTGWEGLTIPLNMQPTRETA